MRPVPLVRAPGVVHLGSLRSIEHLQARSAQNYGPSSFTISEWPLFLAWSVAASPSSSRMALSASCCNNTRTTSACPRPAPIISGVNPSVDSLAFTSAPAFNRISTVSGKASVQLHLEDTVPVYLVDERFQLERRLRRGRRQAATSEERPRRQRSGELHRQPCGPRRGRCSRHGYCNDWLRSVRYDPRALWQIPLVTDPPPGRSSTKSTLQTPRTS